MNPIIHTLARGGSPNGLSRWLKWLECPKRAWLGEQRMNDPAVIAKFIQTYSGALVGTIGHAYMEHFWKLRAKENPIGAIRFAESYVDEDARKEAQRCVEALCKVIAPEGPIPLSRAEIVAIETDMESRQALERFGVPKMTGRLDLALRLDTSLIEALKRYSANTEALNVDGHVGALKPGVWILDYKFYGSRDTNLLDRSLDSIQFSAYQMLYEEANAPAAGLIQVTPFNIKANPVRFTVIPPPGEAERVTVKNLLSQARVAALEVGPLAKPLDHNCFPYKGICPFHHRVGGPCKRY